MFMREKSFVRTMKVGDVDISLSVIGGMPDKSLPLQHVIWVYVNRGHDIDLRLPVYAVPLMGDVRVVTFWHNEAGGVWVQAGDATTGFDDYDAALRHSVLLLENDADVARDRILVRDAERMALFDLHIRNLQVRTSK